MINNFQGFTIQTFDDQKRKEKEDLAQIFPYDQKKIEKLNSKGAGIFFVPNPQVDPTKRSIDNTKALQYLSLDLDVAKEKQGLNQADIENKKAGLLDKLKSLAIPPNYIIVTKNGFQPIWELSKNITLWSVEERHKMNELYKSIIAGFCVKNGLDSEGDNLCRVLRLPGTYHLKNPGESFLITITELNHHKVTLEEFEKTYPPIIKKISKSYQYNPNPTDSIISKIIKYPAQEVLKKLSGTETVDFERFDLYQNSNGTIQIIINGEKRGQWIDPINNTIGGSGKRQGNPTIIQFVQWYGVNRRGEDEKTAKGKAIKTLKQVLAIPDEKTERIFEKSQSSSNQKDINKNNKNNENTNINDNDGCQKNVNFELTESKQEIITKLKKCDYRTPRVEIAKLLEGFFKEWNIYPTHCLYIAQHWNPRAIYRTIDQIMKQHISAQVTIHNPAKYFTKLIRFRKQRRS